MGCGMLLLKDPNNSNYISKTASYIIRQGSNDLGRFTLEGSRPANAVYMHANLSCIGASGYEALMNRSVRICRYMALTLQKSGAFEILFEPMMNILLYRFVPSHLREKLLKQNQELTDEEWTCVDSANAALQEQQKAEGHTFVSRTSVEDAKHGRRLVALRVVIGNPLTEEADIDDVIADQFRIVNEEKPAAVDSPAKAEDMGEEYWCQYWRKMPDAAKQFYMNDAARFRKLAPVV